MKTLLAIMVLALCTTANADEPFENKIYTPEVVVDSQNAGNKGAVQLLWQRDPEATRYEVEVSNGNIVYSQVGERHFHHVMLFFDKDYQWRVREVSARKTTEFSSWRPLRVVRGQKLAQRDQDRDAASTDSDHPVEAFLLDTGEQ